MPGRRIIGLRGIERGDGHERRKHFPDGFGVDPRGVSGHHPARFQGLTQLVQIVGSAGERDRLSGQRLRLLELASPGEDLRSDPSPLDLRGNVVARRRLFAAHRHLHRFVVVPAQIQDLAKLRGKRREEPVLTDVGEGLHAGSHPTLRRFQISAHRVDGAAHHRPHGSHQDETAILEEPLEVSTSTFQWAEKSDPFSYVGPHWVDLFHHYYGAKPVGLTAVGQKKRLARA